MKSTIEQLQDDIFGRLWNDPFLATVSIVEETKGLPASDIAKTMGTNTRRNGKKGAVILVSGFAWDVVEESPGPQLNAFMGISCLEQPQINRAPITGTTLSAETLALRVMQLVHNFNSHGLQFAVTITGKRGDPVLYQTGEREISLRFDAVLQLPLLQACFPPAISGNSDAVNITCLTPSAVIFYTTDGSTPGPQNAASLKFNDPLEDSGGDPITDSTGNPIAATGIFGVASGTLVRAVAFDPTNQLAASGISAKTIT